MKGKGSLKMSKGTKIYMGICSLIIACAVIVGVFTRLSFQGSTTLDQLMSSKNTDKYTIQIFEDDSQDDKFSQFANVKNYDELNKNSVLIAKVKVTHDRSLYSNTVNTRAIIKEIYKSDGNLKKNDNIYIYEPADFEEDFEIFDSTGGYQLMETGKEYYVFLNGLKTAQGYKKSKKEKITFVPSTTKYSVYSAENKKKQVLDNEKINGNKKEYHYGEIKNLSILTFEKNELRTYDNIRTEFMKKIDNKEF